MSATPEAEVHALRELVGGMLVTLAKIDRPHVEAMLERCKAAQGVPLDRMTPDAQRIVPASSMIQRELLENVLSIVPSRRPVA